MAGLIKCKACGNAVSKNAPTCPQCGEPVKKERKPVGCGGAIGLLVLVLIVAAIIGGERNSVGTGSSEPSKPKTAAEIRQDKIERQFSAWDGSHRELERWVEANLKDPDSYEHIETKYGDQGEYITVQMKFRAKNSFGGYVVNTAIGKYSLNGNAIETPVMMD